MLPGNMPYVLKMIAYLIVMVYRWLKSIVMFFVPEKMLYKDVKGEIMLITGGGSGMGQLMSVKFAKLGAAIVSLDVNEAGNAETQKLVKANGGVCHVYHCDVSNRYSVYEIAKRVKSEVGVVTMLVNNAGIVHGKKLLDLEDSQIEKTIGVNTMSFFWTLKAFLPDMMTKNHGHLIYMASVAGLVGNTKCTDYCASKWAVVGLWESLSLELRASKYSGIKSTIICPYMVTTGLFDGFHSQALPMLDPEDTVDRIVSAILSNRMMVILPYFMTYLFGLKWLMPCDSNQSLFDALGGNECMADFVGKDGKPKIR